MNSQDTQRQGKTASEGKRKQLQRLKKNDAPKQQQPKAEPGPSVAASASSPVENPASEIVVEVDQHTEDRKPFSLSDTLTRAGKRLRDLGSDEQPASRKRKAKADPGTEEDFYSLITAGLVLGLSLSRIPQEIKPNEDEISIFGRHLSNIVVRHVPAVGALSPDLMDLIGLVVVSSNYYARVSEDLKRLAPAPRVVDAQAKESRAKSSPGQQETPETIQPESDIARRAPRLHSWLNEAEHLTATGGAE